MFCTGLFSLSATSLQSRRGMCGLKLLLREVHCSGRDAIDMELDDMRRKTRD